jgi:hypothetical protein
MIALPVALLDSSDLSARDQRAFRFASGLSVGPRTLPTAPLPLGLQARSSPGATMTQSLWLPSAARRRALRSGFISLGASLRPPLHFPRLPTADRSRTSLLQLACHSAQFRLPFQQFPRAGHFCRQLCLRGRHNLSGADRKVQRAVWREKETQPKLPGPACPSAYGEQGLPRAPALAHPPSVRFHTCFQAPDRFPRRRDSPAFVLPATPRREARRDSAPPRQAHSWAFFCSGSATAWPPTAHFPSARAPPPLRLPRKKLTRARKQFPPLTRHPLQATRFDSCKSSKRS